MRSLFSTIFLTIWLINMSLIIANAYWLGLMFEKKHVSEQFSKNLDQKLVLMVDEYELFAKDGHKPWRPGSLGRMMRYFQLEIKDVVSGKAVWPLRRHRYDASRTTQAITASSGTRYQVSYLTEPVLTRSFLAIISRLKPSKWIISLLVATLGSSILSFIIVAPIKKIIRHTQQLADGDLAARIEPGLSRRRDEIGQLSNAFNDMSDHLQKLIDNQQSLLHDVSHELRAPLQRLQVAIELTRDQWQVTHRDVTLFDRQQQEVEKLNRMIDGILVLSRLDSIGPTQGGPTPGDQKPGFAPSQQALSANSKMIVVDEISAIVQDLEPFYPSKNIRYSVEGHALTSLHIDVSLFERVVRNILENAMKYTPVCATILIELKVCEHKNTVTITISDNGPGVAPAMMEKLLVPFYRAPQPIGPDTPTNPQGLGLGLSIADKAMQFLNGRLTLAQAPMGGLAVTLTFQRAPSLA